MCTINEIGLYLNQRNKRMNICKTVIEHLHFSDFNFSINTETCEFSLFHCVITFVKGKI